MLNAVFDVFPALREELDALEALLRDEFAGSGFIQAEAARLVFGGGKRLRPAMALASAHVGRYDRARTLPIAAALETLHTATLVHDDVIDEACTRRGNPALQQVHGSHVAVYAGDWLLAKSVQLLARAGLADLELKRLAWAMEALCAGEVSQYLGRGRVPGYREYLKRVMGKTGVLFGSACAAGGRAGGLSESATALLWRFGVRFGAAFQIRDDLLDMQGIPGKPAGQDLASGVVTLPLLLAAWDESFRDRLERFLSVGRPANGIPALLDEARALGAVERSRAALEDEARKAAALLDKLPDGPGAAALRALALSL